MSEWVRLGDVCKSTQGVQIPLSEQITTLECGYIRYLYIGDFKGENKKLYVKNHFPDKIVTENDLVMANTGSPGSVFKGISGVLSNNLFKISFDAKIINRDYLYEYLSSPIFQKRLQGKMKGGIQKHLGHKTFGEQSISLHSLSEQQHIVSVLDSVNSLIDARKKQIALLDEAEKSLFMEMFGDPVENPMGWDVGTINDVVSNVNYGTSKPAETSGYYPYLRMNNITYDGKLDLSNLKYINLSETEAKRYLVYYGDVLFNRTNSKELVGKTCVFKSHKPMIIAGYLIRVRPNERAEAEYISAFLNSKHGKKTLSNMCRSIIGQANINAQELRGISLPLPPISLQKEFASQIDRIEEQRTVFKRGLAKLEEEYKALMQEYFG